MPITEAARTCSQCGTEIPPSARSGARFCSDACRVRNWREHRARASGPGGPRGARASLPSGPWEPKSPPRRDIAPPPGCGTCGTPRQWTLCRTAAACAGCGTLSLLTAQPEQETAPARREPTYEEESLADMAIGAEQGRLDEQIGGLLRSGRMDGGSRGVLKRLSRRVEKASSLEQLAVLRGLLDQFAAAAALQYRDEDDEDDLEGEVVYDSRDEEDDEDYPTTADILKIFGDLAPALPGRAAGFPARVAGNPAARFRDALAPGHSAGPGLPAAQPDPPPPPPLTHGEAEILRAAQARQASDAAQVLVGEYLSHAGQVPGAVHAAIAASTGRMPDYPRRQPAPRRRFAFSRRQEPLALPSGPWTDSDYQRETLRRLRRTS